MATDFIERIPKETQTMAHRPGMRSVARTPSPLLFPLSRTGLSVLMAAGLAAGGALPRAALAQAGAAAASAAQRPFQVPAGPLAAALTAFAADAGISISAPPALVQGRRTQGVQGRLTVREALDRLLAGTDLQAQAAGEGGFVLRVVPEATQASMVLGEVKVTATAQAESPWGSTSGYVARRASTATKTDASILEVAQSVSVITRDRMDDQGVRTLNDAVQYTAGVRTNTGGANPADDSLSVRGFSQFSGNFYLDGLRLMPLGTLAFSAWSPTGPSAWRS
jgi:iron complex outermembrane receptor protein